MTKSHIKWMKGAFGFWIWLQSRPQVLGGLDVDPGGLQLGVLDEGQHALVSSHETVCSHVCLPGQQPAKRVDVSRRGSASVPRTRECVRDCTYARVRKGMYMSRGMQIICCSAKMAFMDCWTV